MKFSKGLIYIFFGLIIIIASFFVFYLSTFNSKFNDLIKAVSIENQVDYTLCLAIAKAESKFNQNAKSSANAIGIMQIKLETANYMKQIYGEKQLVEEELFLPQNNIVCGIQYIKYLMNRFEDVDVVICAYNAGETVVRSWLNDNYYSNDGKTLSKIPYKETQNYLKKVKYNQNIYRKIA